jgi:hypothetical protein
MQKNTLIYLPAFFLALSSFCLTGKSALINKTVVPENYCNRVVSYDDILIGKRTSENSAQVSITKAGIQQNIIIPIQELNGVVVTDDPISIQVNKITSYLIFSVNNAGGKKISVALELVQISNDLIFRAKNGMEIHICKSNGNCNSCEFVFDSCIIIACTCNSGYIIDSVATNCHHRGTISK